MILLYPLILAIALVVMHRARRRRVAYRGPPWFGAWALAGALFTLSLLTGFSIGLWLLPLPAFIVVSLACRAPRWRDASGFVVGAALVVAVVFV